MTVHREYRPNQQSAEERLRERELREKLQREKPSLDDLIRSGECDPDAVMTMGMYFDVQGALQSLKETRKANGLSIGDVAERSGLDRAVVSRLENGKQDNPTVATLMRYAAAIGKRFTWTYEDLPKQQTGSPGNRRMTGSNGSPSAGRKTRNSIRKPLTTQVAK